MGTIARLVLGLLSSWVEEEARQEAARLGVRLLLLVVATGLLLGGCGLLLYALYLVFCLLMHPIAAVAVTGAGALGAGLLLAWKLKS
ncbi:MAG: hypothetical protein EYC70_09810 [Planctomycetota bacterium]|nr:MAG: hypothetical protein EYC70_09810 [Planctomycetota bacterium]